MAKEKTTDKDDKATAEKRDAVLKRMLETPPKPKQGQTKSTKGRKK